MKNILYLLCAGLLITACSPEDVTPDPLANLSQASVLQNATHKITLYTPSGRLESGYNAVTLKITDLDGNETAATDLTWSPLMHMHNMKHGCPASTISPVDNRLHEGYLVFQMASNETEYWELTVNYTVNGTDYSVTGKVTVTESLHRGVQSFQGTDGKRYILASAGPAAPKVGVNDMKALVYEMKNMMTFAPVTGYRVLIDPRMPGMGNHSSPNNVHLARGNTDFYEGKLNLTMTGYWKINLQLEGPGGEILKGEAITGEIEASSIFFDLEF